MNGLQKIFKQTAMGERSTGVEWFDAVRHDAVLAWGEVELPTTKQEDYRRFDVRAVMDGVVTWAEGDCSGFESLDLDADVVIRTDNGATVDKSHSLLNGPKSEEYNSLCDGAATAVLNTALATDVVVVRVARGESRNVVT